MHDRKHMKQAILKRLLPALILGEFLFFTLPAADLAPFSDITPDQAAGMIKEKSPDPLFKIIDVRTAAGAAREAVVYVAGDPATGQTVPGYMERVVAAAELHGLPAPYIAVLKGWMG